MLPAWKSQIIHGGGERGGRAIASAAAVGRGRWHSAVLHLAKHVPWAVLRARARARKETKRCQKRPSSLSSAGSSAA
jgi:hypothetical protein